MLPGLEQSMQPLSWAALRACDRETVAEPCSNGTESQRDTATDGTVKRNRVTVTSSSWRHPFPIGSKEQALRGSESRDASQGSLGRKQERDCGLVEAISLKRIEVYPKTQEASCYIYTHTHYNQVHGWYPARINNLPRMHMCTLPPTSEPA